MMHRLEISSFANKVELENFANGITEYLLKLGFDNSAIKKDATASIVSYNNAHIKGFLQIHVDKRGRQTLVATKHLIEGFFEVLNDPNTALHFAFKNMYRVVYITDPEKLDKALMQSQDCVVCCFDPFESLCIIDCQKGELFEISCKWSNGKVSSRGTVDEIRTRVNLVPVDISITFPYHVKIFCFIMTLCVLFDVNKCASSLKGPSSSLWHLQAVPFSDDVILPIISHSLLRTTLQPHGLKEVDSRESIDGQTYIEEVNGKSVPVKHWFKARGQMPGQILDLASPYWKDVKCDPGERILDPTTLDRDEVMSYTLHRLPNGKFYLEPDWSPYLSDNPDYPSGSNAALPANSPLSASAAQSQPYPSPFVNNSVPSNPAPPSPIVNNSASSNPAPAPSASAAPSQTPPSSQIPPSFLVNNSASSNPAPAPAPSAAAASAAPPPPPPPPPTIVPPPPNRVPLATSTQGNRSTGSIIEEMRTNMPKLRPTPSRQPPRQEPKTGQPAVLDELMNNMPKLRSISQTPTAAMATNPVPAPMPLASSPSPEAASADETTSNQPAAAMANVLPVVPAPTVPMVSNPAPLASSQSPEAASADETTSNQPAAAMANVLPVVPAPTVPMVSNPAPLAFSQSPEAASADETTSNQPAAAIADANNSLPAAITSDAHMTSGTSIEDSHPIWREPNPELQIEWIKNTNRNEVEKVLHARYPFYKDNSTDSKKEIRLFIDDALKQEKRFMMHFRGVGLSKFMTDYKNLKERVTGGAGFLFPQPYPKPRLFLNTYYIYKHGHSNYCCGSWQEMPVQPIPYRENDRFAKIRSQMGYRVLDEYQWINKRAVPLNVHPDAGAALPEPQPPFVEPKTGDKLIHHGILYSEHNSEWKMELGQPTEEHPDYMAVMTPLGARFFKKPGV